MSITDLGGILSNMYKKDKIKFYDKFSAFSTDNHDFLSYKAFDPSFTSRWASVEKERQNLSICFSYISIKLTKYSFRNEETTVGGHLKNWSFYASNGKEWSLIHSKTNSGSSTPLNIISVETNLNQYYRCFSIMGQSVWRGGLIWCVQRIDFFGAIRNIIQIKCSSKANPTSITMCFVFLVLS